MRSYLAEYDLIVPPTLPRAIEMLALNEGWRPIAGGTDLMVLFNAGKLPYRRLIGIGHLPELRRIEVATDSVVLGAAVTYTQIRNHGLLANEFPMLCSAASWTGGIANQNRGTLGGNISNASPAADSAPVLLAYDADLHLTSARGTRRLPYKTFHLSYKRTALADDELITAIELPRSSARGTHYARKVGPRQAQAIAKVCIAAYAQFENGLLRDLRVALGSVAPIPLRCEQTEAALIGRILNPNLISNAQDVLRSEISPITDIRSTEWYRTQVSINLLTEFLRNLK
jgi:CO/xanthine dehydrogenase FAD-binding subunit